MLLVSGATKAYRPYITEREDIFGTLVTAIDGNSLPEIGRWAADNGAWAGASKKCEPCNLGRVYVCGQHSARRVAKFEAMLTRHLWARSRCLFVLAPDVVSDHHRTLELFEEWAPKLAGWPIAFAAQDGCTAPLVPWDRIAAVFIGGSDRFKLGREAREIVFHARARGLWIHMGRVNAPARIHYAALIGCDSVDGSGYSKHNDEMLINRGHAALFRDLVAQRRLTLEGLGEEGL